MSVVISIDPGISGTGIAVWDYNDWKSKKLRNPIACYNWYPRDATEFVGKSNELLNKLSDLAAKHIIEEVWCEMPEFFDDAGGHMVAKKGDLQKLTFLVGAFSGLCYNYDIPFYPVTPVKWKGQTSKDMVIRKLYHLLPDLDLVKPKSHSYDAIGIGLYAQGLYKR